jgi:hypothetical protein
LRPTSLWKTIYLTRLSQPKSDRLIYRAMLRSKPRRIVELGLRQGQRALRLIDAATRYVPREEIRYIGIDPFEDRTAEQGPGLTLINAHRLLKSSGARIQLIPGNPLDALIRSANHLGAVDLIIISRDGSQETEPGPQFWSYLLRLLQPDTMVFQEKLIDGRGPGIQQISHQDIRSRTAAPRRLAA